MTGRTGFRWFERFGRRPACKSTGSLLLFALVGLALGLAEPAGACAVCYGSEGSDMVTGMNNGIVTLLAVIGFVQVGFMGLFGSIWYRTRKLRKLREQFHVIEGER